jgi:hypothetical protein
MQIGLVFVYLCWIQSGRLFKSLQTSSPTIIKRILHDLNTMRSSPEHKLYIQQLCLQALVLLVKKLATTGYPDLFASLVLPTIEQELKSVWTSKSKDNLNLLLACLNTYNAETNKFLKKCKLDLKSVFSFDAGQGANGDYFYELISQSSEHLPNLEPVCTELLDYLAKYEPEMLRDFWVRFLDVRLYAKREPEKKYLGYKLYIYSLSLLDEHNMDLVFYQALLKCKNVLYNFVFSYTNKFNSLNGVCRETVGRELAQVLKSLESKNAGVSVGGDLSIRIIENGRNCHDLSDLISLLAHTFNESSLTTFFEYLTQDFLKEDSEYVKILQKKQVKFKNFFLFILDLRLYFKSSIVRIETKTKV